jgi:hypothetical protein
MEKRKIEKIDLQIKKDHIIKLLLKILKKVP